MLSSLEEAFPAPSAWVPTVLFPSRADPQVAQIVLAAIARSIMTVVSIVFAILLMTLTLASMQFSPRVCRHRTPALPREGLQAAGAHVPPGRTFRAGWHRAVLRLARGTARSRTCRRAAFGIRYRTDADDAAGRRVGVIQIIDTALKAISPAVNDPSTAISCVNKLGRILIRFVRRKPPVSVLCDPPHVVRVIVPWIGIEGLLDTAFEQIRHYSTSDLAVSLRLLRALDDIASTGHDAGIIKPLVVRGRRIVSGCAERLSPDQIEKLRQRLSALEARMDPFKTANVGEAAPQTD